MRRVDVERTRLYGITPEETNVGAAAVTDDAPHPVRAGVLELARPAGWEQLGAVWKGVQADLELPAPAIAISGADGLQLWFSWTSPVPSGVARRFLDGLRERYLAGVSVQQVRAFGGPADLPTAPPVETGPQRWSAFVTPDLASVFAESPWLDIPPTDDGQASILRQLEPMPAAAFEVAMTRLVAAAPTAEAAPPDTMRPAPVDVQRAVADETDPAAFLTRVMNDPAAPLALRIDAAGLLLGAARRRPSG